MLVTRESEWDDSARDRALALADYEDGLCRCGCGQPMEQAHTPEQAYRVHSYTCQAGRALDIQRRAARDAAKKANGGEEVPEGWDDGLHFYATPVSAEELQAEIARRTRRRDDNDQEGRVRRRG